MRTFIEFGIAYDKCSECSDIRSEGMPDVYLPRSGMTFQALCDKMGNPIPIQSKRHKKQVMDELGLREHPDRLSGNTNWIDGSRDYRKRQFEKDRPMIRETLNRWKQTKGA